MLKGTAYRTAAMVALLAALPAKGDPAPSTLPAVAVDPLDVAYREARADPRVPPEHERPPVETALPRIALEAYRLPNGLDVALSPGGSDRFVHLRVTYRVGSRDAPPERRELAHLVEHLASQRTRHAPDGVRGDYAFRCAEPRFLLHRRND